MTDHNRLLGALFIGFALVQVVGAVLAVFAVRPTGGAPPLLLGAMALVAIAYGWGGMQLRRRRPGVRGIAIALSLFALLSFPIGTAIGIYGLWVLFARRESTATG